LSGGVAQAVDGVKVEKARQQDRQVIREIGVGHAERGHESLLGQTGEQAPQGMIRLGKPHDQGLFWFLATAIPGNASPELQASLRKDQTQPNGRRSLILSPSPSSQSVDSPCVVRYKRSRSLSSNRRSIMSRDDTMTSVMYHLRGVDAELVAAWQKYF